MGTDSIKSRSSSMTFLLLLFSEAYSENAGFLDTSRAGVRAIIPTPWMIVVILDTHPKQDSPGKVSDQFIHRLSLSIEGGDRGKNDRT